MRPFRTYSRKHTSTKSSSQPPPAPVRQSRRSAGLQPERGPLDVKRRAQPEREKQPSSSAEDAGGEDAGSENTSDDDASDGDTSDGDTSDGDTNGAARAPSPVPPKKKHGAPLREGALAGKASFASVRVAPASRSRRASSADGGGDQAARNPEIVLNPPRPSLSKPSTKLGSPIKLSLNPAPARSKVLDDGAPEPPRFELFKKRAREVFAASEGGGGGRADSAGSKLAKKRAREVDASAREGAHDDDGNDSPTPARPAKKRAREVDASDGFSAPARSESVQKRTPDVDARGKGGEPALKARRHTAAVRKELASNAQRSVMAEARDRARDMLARLDEPTAPEYGYSPEPAPAPAPDSEEERDWQRGQDRKWERSQRKRREREEREEREEHEEREERERKREREREERERKRELEELRRDCDVSPTSGRDRERDSSPEGVAGRRDRLSNFRGRGLAKKAGKTVLSRKYGGRHGAFTERPILITSKGDDKPSSSHTKLFDAITRKGFTMHARDPSYIAILAMPISARGQVYAWASPSLLEHAPAFLDDAAHSMITGTRPSRAQGLEKAIAERDRLLNAYEKLHGPLPQQRLPQGPTAPPRPSSSRKVDAMELGSDAEDGRNNYRHMENDNAASDIDEGE